MIYRAKHPLIEAVFFDGTYESYLEIKKTFPDINISKYFVAEFPSGANSYMWIMTRRGNGGQEYVGKDCYICKKDIRNGYPDGYYVIYHKDQFEKKYKLDNKSECKND